MAEARTSRDYLDQADPEQHLYLKILQDFPALIWRSNTDGLCDYFNSTWLDFTGRTMEQEYGNGWAEGVHPEDLQRCVDYYFEHFHRHEGFSMQYRLMHKSGEYRWILDIGRPFWGLDDEFLGFIGSCYDITEQRNLTDELVALSDLRDRILGITGHDLRNMMGIIRGMGGLLKNEISSRNWETSMEYIELINGTASNCIHLLSNLLDWGRSRTGKRLTLTEFLDPRKTIRENLELFESSMKSKGIELSLDLEEEPSLLIKGDPDYLATLIRNLVNNAFKYTPRGGRIVIRCLRRHRANAVPGDRAGEQGTEVLVVVSDSGVGMNKDTLERVLHGMAGQSSKGTENEGGSGLGLSICHTFLAALGGSMEISSEPGKGSTFTLAFPEVSKDEQK